MKFNNDPDGRRLPIKLDNTSNGEFMPRPLPAHVRHMVKTAQENATQNARKINQSRRNFMVSLSGAATCLLAMNQVNAALGKTGGRFELPADAAFDNALAGSVLKKREFIFDIQTHHFDPVPAWSAPTRWSEVIRQTAGNTGCNILPDHDFGHMTCTDSRAFVREMFLDSDTDAAVLSFVPTAEHEMPLSYREASATRQIVNAMKGNKRLLLHGRIIPNLPGDLERMDSVLEHWDIAAWKTYTQYGPDATTGWWLDDEKTGGPFLEKVRQSGVKIVCCHKGLPLAFPLMGDQNVEYRSCRDVGPAAKANPDIAFIIYHSGFDPDIPEGPYIAGQHVAGSDSLIQSISDSGLQPNSNVYAEIGTTWQSVMREPDQAAHFIGKMLKYVGEDNLLWGTDCIFYGSPQDQIQAFRSFQISDQFQQQFGYPKLTDAIRAKVFGLNSVRAYGLDLGEFSRHAADDAIGRAKTNYMGRHDPSFQTYGPRTRRELLTLARFEQG